jgi:hypothetical protein
LCVYRGGHQDQLDVVVLAQEVLQYNHKEFGLNSSFVDLVHDDVCPREFSALLDPDNLLDEHTVGHEGDGCVVVVPLVASDMPSDLIPDVAVQLLGDTLGNSDACDTPWLCHNNPTLALLLL